MRRAPLCAVVLVWWCVVGVVRGDDWPRWAGPNRNAISAEAGLLASWPDGGPPLAWRIDGLGAGMGGLAVYRDRLYTTGDLDGTAWLLCCNEQGGELIWKKKIGPGGNPGFIFQPDGPRATPTIDGDRIYALGQFGDLVCFTLDGDEVWRKHYLHDLQGVMPKWGYSESPLIDDSTILCVPGGPDATLVAVDKASGDTLWTCHVPEGEFDPRYGNDSAAGYSSAIVIECHGVRQYVQLTSTAVVGVEAASGTLLWRYDRPVNTHRIPCSTPIYDDGVVFASSAYDAGGGAVRLVKEADGRFAADELYFNPIMKNHHGGIILADGCLYGAAGGNFGGFLVCLDFATGERLWAERSAPKGSLTMADDRLYLRAEDGTLILIEPDRTGYRERGRFMQPNRTRQPAWTHPVIANGKLYIRDQDMLFCYDIAQRAAP